MNTRQKLLNELKKNKGQYLSGEALSALFDISRAAVSKHIAVLKEAGYGIESSPKIGYKLTEITQKLLPEELQDGLKTTILGQGKIYYYHDIDSTNNRAKELATQGVPDGTIVVAEKQTAGRGRKGRSWFSASGEGICLSMILRPSITPAEIPQITLMTAVAVAEALIELTPLDITIKWPNDILVDGKKLAGILTEMSMEMDAVDYVVTGLGLNVNTEQKAFSHDISSIATSILIETGTPFSRADIVKAFLQQFEAYYKDVQKNGFAHVIKRWKELSNIIGKHVIVDVTGRQIPGTVEDIGEDGVLLLKGNDGRIHRVISGDVIF